MYFKDHKAKIHIYLSQKKQVHQHYSDKTMSTYVIDLLNE